MSDRAVRTACALLLASLAAINVHATNARADDRPTVHHAFPRAPGPSASLRKGVAAIVRSHIAAAGFQLVAKSKATWLLATHVRAEGTRLVVDVRFRRKVESQAKEAIALATPDTLLAVVGDLLQQVMPRTGASTPLPASEPPVGTTYVKEKDSGRSVLSTWVEDQPKWGNVHKVGPKLAPFPPADEPPPELGEIPR